MSFWHLSGTDPTAPALFLGSDSNSAAAVSYDELAAGADTFRRRLGMEHRKRVGVVLCRNAPEMIMAYLGALSGGDAVLLLNEATDPVLLQAIVDIYRPEWVYRPAGESVPSGYEGDGQTGLWQLFFRREPDRGAAPHRDLAVLLSTSGTTGSPKMVRLSYSNIEVNAHAIVDYLAIGPGERAITTLPFNYSYGMSVVNSHLAAGASLVLTEARLLTREFWNTFTHHAVTSLSGVPYTYQMLHRLNPRKLGLDSLATLTQAGGRLAPQMVEYFRELAMEKGWRFFVMYGQTEAAPRISYVPPAMLAIKAGSIGLPIPGGRLSISPDGELIYEGANVMMGYGLNREDLALGDELGGRLATGDLASMDAEGYYYLHGRLKRFVKIHGNRVSLDDIEARLEAEFHQPVAVIGEDDKIQVFIAPGAESAAAKALLTGSYRLHPTTFNLRQIEAIPHTESGKKDYGRLTK